MNDQVRIFHFLEFLNKVRSNHLTLRIPPPLDTLPEDQQYVVLLSHYSGIQLEEFCSNHNLTPDETHSILRQICCSLAAAEQKYQFEHR